VHRIAVVVPCYNEYARLRTEKFQTFAAANPDVSFLFVNDGSTDGTQEMIDALHHSNPAQFLTAALKRNQGKAEAVRRGFLHAMEMDFDTIGYWDADLSTSLGHIKKFAEQLRPPDVTIVMGARVRLLGRTIERGKVRHYLGRGFATFVSILLGLPIYDSQCGAKLFHNDACLHKVFREPFTVHWIFDVEILARYRNCHDGKERIENLVVEYPLDSWVHRPGSKIKKVDFLVAAWEMIKLLFLYRLRR
jgi:dolichyl-phosphate beta-glucosyltransferase